MSERVAVLAGVGAALPAGVVTNAMLAERLDTSDEWITSRTGIRERRWVEGMTTSDLAVAAGERALRSAGAPVDMVILATTTPDHPCPATAPAVAARLGLGTIAAFDVAAVCAGFAYGLAVGSAAIAGGLANGVLVIGAETFSTILDPADRGTAVIFGDGAGAAVLRAGEAGEPGAVEAVHLGSDGDLAELITVRDGYFRMEGKQVFRTAVARMAESVGAVLARTGWDTTDWLIGHQANARILHAVAEQVGLPAERAYLNLDRVGNTSAASIPLALADGALAGAFAPGQRMVLTAFGGGAAWGAAALTWPDLKVEEF